MQNLFRDLQYGLRSLLKRPGFTAVTVLTLALGIGANSAIFSVINATLMRPMPVSDPDRLVFVFHGQAGSVFSYPDYLDFRDQNQVFDGLIAWGGITASLNSNDQTDQVGGVIVSGNYFNVLGVRAALGRVITPDDDKTPGAHPVAVISDGLWRTRFGADANIIGRQLLLNGNNFTVIGVLPAEFGGLQMGTVRDLYVPMMMQATMRPPRAGYSGEMNPDLLGVRSNRWLFGVGRLKPGVTAEQARNSLTLIAKQLEQAYPQSNRNKNIVNIFALTETDDPATRQQLSSVAKLLMAVVGIVLLIACANVANLLLARGSARTKEIAVRLAIGATRGRIVRQLLTEGILLATLGGAAGLLLSWWTIRSLIATPPPAGALPINPQFSVDLKVLLFTFGLSLLAGVVFALAPALRVSRPALVPALKDDSTTFFERTRTFSLRNLLVVTQVALSVVLLVTAGLFLRSLWRAQKIDPGFEAEKVLTLPLNINLLRYTKPQGREFYRQVIERVEAIPGVESASLARVVAVSGGSSVRSLLIEGRSAPDNRFRSDNSGPAISDDSTNANVVGLRYFQTMGIPLLQGREFSQQDNDEHPPVVIVNDAFVRRHFGNEAPLGRRLSINGPNGPWREIIGVVRDSKYWSLGEPPTPVAYVPLQQNHETGMTLHVRTTVDPSTVAAAIRSETQSLEKNLPLANPQRMSELVGNSLYAARMGALLLAVFGGLALLLASIGLYGVMSFAVARRTRELGIRIALGARPGDLLGLVLRQGMFLVVAGLLIGLIVAAMLTRLLASFLYGISTTDTLTFVGIPVLLTLVALLACYLPARRATNVDPLVALRYE